VQWRRLEFGRGISDTSRAHSRSGQGEKAGQSSSIVALTASPNETRKRDEQAVETWRRVDQENKTPIALPARLKTVLYDEPGGVIPEHWRRWQARRGSFVASPLSNAGDATLSFRFDARCLDDRPPFLSLGLVESMKRFRRLLAVGGGLLSYGARVPWQSRRRVRQRLRSHRQKWLLGPNPRVA
jgi:hypothetical protein